MAKTKLRGPIQGPLSIENIEDCFSLLEYEDIPVRFILVGSDVWPAFKTALGGELQPTEDPQTASLWGSSVTTRDDLEGRVHFRGTSNQRWYRHEYRVSPEYAHSGASSPLIQELNLLPAGE